MSPETQPLFLTPDVCSRFQGSQLCNVGLAAGIEIGRPGETFQEVRIERGFEKLTVLITGGRLPYPYGQETTGYELKDLSETAAKAKARAPLF